MSDGGKGSAPRPFSVPHEKFSDNWENIFGKKKDQPEEKVDENVEKNK